jgi:Ca2+:H+ antiporter
MAICCLQQIAAFVIPLLVIIGWMTGHELTLFFADFEVRLLYSLEYLC